MPRPGSTRLVRLIANLFMARFSPADIDRVARTPLRIGVAGDGALVQRFRDLTVLGRLAQDVPFPTLSLHALPADDPAQHWHLLDDCQVVVVLLRRDDLIGDVVYRVKEALPAKVTAVWAGVGAVEPWLRGEIDDIAADLKIGPFIWIDALEAETARPLLRQIVRTLGGYELAVARKMPLFRDLVAARIIGRTSRQNLMIAMASALPSSLPWIGPIVGLLGVTAEIIFLTSNQLRMVLQLASVYDQDMRVAERLKELLPVTGGAFGWRALSRELVGFIPAIGPGIKGSIAYAATHATGEAARWLYKTGTHMDAEERRRIYEEALVKGETLSGAVADLLPALAPAETQALVEEGQEPSSAASRLDAIEAADTATSAAPLPADIAAPPMAEEPPAPAEAAPPMAEESPPAASDPSPTATPPVRPRIDVERNAGRRRSRKAQTGDGPQAPTEGTPS